MDRKSDNKILNFFKKEGFYVVLFVCLCIFATVVALTAKSNKSVNGKPPIAIKNSTNRQKDKDINVKTEVPSNATQVNETKNNEKEKTAQVTTPASAPAPAVQTAAKPVLSFTKPVAGTLLLGFSDLAEIEPTDSKTIQSIETVNGMYITSKIGQDVFAAESGEVVDNSASINFGQVITIKHENGYKTVYGNLAEKLSVKVGDKVTKGSKIATVGKTSNHYPSYKALNDGFVYFQVLKNDVPIDPVTCGIKY